MNEEAKISKENAEQMFSELLDYYDLEVDEDSEDVTERLIAGMKKKFVRAFMRGRLELDSRDGRLFVIQHLRGPSKTIENGVIEYKPLNGRARVAMKSDKDSNHYARIYQMLSVLAGLPEASIRNLEGADLGLAEDLATLFQSV